MEDGFLQSRRALGSDKYLSNVPYWQQELNSKLDRIESKLDKLLDKTGTAKSPGQREAAGITLY
jgi:hypothetical protein